MSNITLIERNYHGAYIIYGAIGHMQYIGYTKKEAIAKYNKECKNSKSKRGAI